MFDKSQMEIPESVRQVAEKNVEQVRSAYLQFMEMTRQAQTMMMHSTGAFAESAREIQTRSLRYAEQNMEAGFALARDLARAKDLKEYLEIQQRHAQSQIQSYTEQAQELGRLMASAAQSTTPR
jgi:phasin